MRDRLVVRHPKQRELGKRVRFLGTAGEQEAPHLIEVGLCVRVRLIEEPRPQRLLVDLERLLVDPTEDHPPEPAVADGHRPNQRVAGARHQRRVAADGVEASLKTEEAGKPQASI